jgi:hypothetical protein
VILGVAGLIGSVGADSRWLAALGQLIARTGHIPRGVPFAVAPTAGWRNVPVLAELIFQQLDGALGDRGLMLAQLVAVALAVAILARDALAAGAAPTSVGRALLLAALGSLPSLAVARVQLFSLALFPVLVAVLRAEARSPSRRIWWVVPILAVWSNLHGAALLGLAIALTYLLVVRLRQDARTAVAVAIVATSALCLTPSGVGTIAYYHGVFTNVAAARGDGLWAPLSLSAPLDVVLVISAIALITPLRRAQPPLWEVVVIAGLVGLTIHASRSGIWLLFFLVAPSAAVIRPGRGWHRVFPALGAAALAALAYSAIRGPLANGASPSVIARAVRLANGGAVLAPDILAEQVALEGGRVWVGNPIDAFDHADQAAYLDWIEGNPGGRRALTREVDVVLTTRGSSSQRLMRTMRDYAVVSGRRTTLVYQRVSAGTG